MRNLYHKAVKRVITEEKQELNMACVRQEVYRKLHVGCAKVVKYYEFDLKRRGGEEGKKDACGLYFKAASMTGIMKEKKCTEVTEWQGRTWRDTHIMCERKT